jgi:DNA-binding CsgD family transcriptional regulator
MSMMNTESAKAQSWDRLIGDLYDSVLNPAGFADTLGQLDKWFGSSFCHLLVWNEHDDAHHTSIFTEPDFLSASVPYAAYYGNIDPRREMMERLPVGSVFACHDHFDERFVSRSEFYQDLIIPLGARYILLSRFLGEDGLGAYIVFNHLKDQGAFSAEQRAHMQRLAAHLGRVFRMMKQSERTRAAMHAGEAALDTSDQGVFTLAAGERIVFANRCARQMLKSGRWLTGRGNTLRARSASDAGRLAAAFARVRLSRRAETLALHAQGGHPLTPADRQIVTVLPAPAVGFAPGEAIVPEAGITGIGAAAPPRDALLLDRVELVVLVSAQRRQASASATQLGLLFDLTPAEARLAAQLAKGVAVDEYASNQGVSVATVRTQVRSLLAKTGEKRLQDLTRMLSMVPACD